MACELGDAASAELLMGFGADLSVTDQVSTCRFSVTSAVLPVSIRNLEVTAVRLVVLWLVVQGGATLLHLAASAGHVGLMQALLTAGADARSLDEVY